MSNRWTMYYQKKLNMIYSFNNLTFYYCIRQVTTMGIRFLELILMSCVHSAAMLTVISRISNSIVCYHIHMYTPQRDSIGLVYISKHLGTQIVHCGTSPLWRPFVSFCVRILPFVVLIISTIIQHRPNHIYTNEPSALKAY